MATLMEPMATFWVPVAVKVAIKNTPNGNPNGNPQIYALRAFQPFTF